MIDPPNKRILIIGPAWVGDMVMAQSLFRLLIAKNTSAHIDVLAPAWSEPLLARMPEVRQAFALDIGHGQLHLKERYRLARAFAANDYDQAIVLPNSWKSALIPWLARIPQRTGWCGEMRYGLLNDLRYLDEQGYPMMVQRFAALALEAGECLPQDFAKPKLTIDGKEQAQTLQILGLKHDAPVLALCPGAEFGRAKQWPAAYYATVAREKLKQGWQVWLLGSPNDVVVAQEIQSLTQHACVDLSGKTSLTQAIDVLSAAHLVLANDSGLMHIAAALGLPLVAFYGSTDPKFAPPLADKAKSLCLDLSCSPCAERDCPLGHHACMLNLTPNRALAAIEEVQNA